MLLAGNKRKFPRGASGRNATEPTLWSIPGIRPVHPQRGGHPVPSRGARRGGSVGAGCQGGGEPLPGQARGQAHDRAHDRQDGGRPTGGVGQHHAQEQGRERHPHAGCGGCGDADRCQRRGRRAADQQGRAGGHDHADGHRREDGTTAEPVAQGRGVAHELAEQHDQGGADRGEGQVVGHGGLPGEQHELEAPAGDGIDGDRGQGHHHGRPDHGDQPGAGGQLGHALGAEPCGHRHDGHEDGQRDRHGQVGELDLRVGRQAGDRELRLAKPRPLLDPHLQDVAGRHPGQRGHEDQRRGHPGTGQHGELEHQHAGDQRVAEDGTDRCHRADDHHDLSDRLGRVAEGQGTQGGADGHEGRLRAQDGAERQAAQGGDDHRGDLAGPDVDPEAVQRGVTALAGQLLGEERDQGSRAEQDDHEPVRRLLLAQGLGEVGPQEDLQVVLDADEERRPGPCQQPDRDRDEGQHDDLPRDRGVPWPVGHGGGRGRTPHSLVRRLIWTHGHHGLPPARAARAADCRARRYPTDRLPPCLSGGAPGSRRWRWGCSSQCCTRPAPRRWTPAASPWTSWCTSPCSRCPPSP